MEEVDGLAHRSRPIEQVWPKRPEIGYSPTASSLLTIITVTEDGAYGVNGWRSNETDMKRYREEAP